jgi:hypothetical protein
MTHMTETRCMPRCLIFSTFFLFSVVGVGVDVFWVYFLQGGLLKGRMTVVRSPGKRYDLLMEEEHILPSTERRGMKQGRTKGVYS